MPDPFPGPTELQQIYDSICAYSARADRSSSLKADQFGYLFTGAFAALKQNTHAMSLLLKAELYAQSIVIARVSYEIGTRMKWAGGRPDGFERLGLYYLRQSVKTMKLGLTLESHEPSLRDAAAKSVDEIEKKIAEIAGTLKEHFLPNMKDLLKIQHQEEREEREQAGMPGLAADYVYAAGCRSGHVTPPLRDGVVVARHSAEA